MPNSCTSIAGARSATYTLVAADAGKWVIAAVSAANNVATGTKWTASAVAAVAELPPPTNTTAPKLFGKAQIGEFVTVGVGVWTESPTSYSYLWFSCDEPSLATASLPESCVELEGETSWQYEVSDADAGKYILAEVTARNSSGLTKAYSTSSAAVPGLPTVLSWPTVSGAPLVDGNLTANEGYWDLWNVWDYDVEYQWLRCDEPSESTLDFPETCQPIVFETSSDYWMTDEDSGSHIVVAITAINDLGSTVAYSASTSMVEYGLFVSGWVNVEGTGDPVPNSRIEFSNVDSWNSSDSTYTDDDGYFEATLAPGDYRIAISADGGIVGGYLPSGSLEFATVYSIAEDTELQLSVQLAGYVDGYICGVNAENWYFGDTGALSLWQVGPDGRWFEAATHDGDFDYWGDEEDLSTGTGCLEYRFSDVAPGMYKLFIGDPWESEPYDERKWYGDATTIEAGEWVVVEPDEWTTLLDIELSPSVVSQQGAAPVVTRTEMAGGEAIIRWTKPQSVNPILGYQLDHSCGGGGSGWILLGADTREETVVDEGHGGACFYSVRTVTTTGQSAAGRVVLPGVGNQGPEITVLDVTSTGFNVIAQSGESDAEEYWFVLAGDVPQREQEDFRINLLDQGETLGDPWSVDYTNLVPGKSYTLLVASRTSAGSESWTNFTTTTIVMRNAPIISAPPVITGTARVANSLTVSNGTWTESPYAYTQDWYRCTEASAASATKPRTCEYWVAMETSSYTLTKSDAGGFMVAAVTAENQFGSTTVYSASTQAIAGLPVNTAAPAITGNARYKNTLTTSTGTWTESPRGYSYQWYKCDESSVVSSAAPSTCVEVAGARSSKYSTKAKDLGYYFVAAVTARNSIGSATRWSASTQAIAGLPVNTVAPSVGGDARIGEAMTLSVGTWTESPRSYSYQWFQCDEATTVSSLEPDACYAIDGATSWTYLVDVADAGMFLVAEVTARNSLGFAVRYSASSAEVAGLPLPLNAPSISGAPIVDSSISVGSGYWSEDPSDFEYQWLRCADESEATSVFPVSCEPIMFETESNYAVLDSDEGMFIVAAVTAINEIGSRTTYTASTKAVGYGVLAFGYVTVDDTGEPLAFTSLNFSNAENYQFSSYAFTDEFGYFETTLVPGDYRISVSTQDESLVGSWLPNGSYELADVYSITDESELNLSVQRAGSITGSIVSSVDGELTGDATVSLWMQSPNGSWVGTGWYDYIDEPGFFTFSGVAPGTYKMFIGQAWNATRLLQMGWYGNASTPETSPDIVVVSGEILDLPVIVLNPVTASPPAAAPTVTTTLLPSGDIRINWTKPVSNSPILGYNLGIGCGWSGDGMTVMGADELVVVLDWWNDTGRIQACEATVTPFTTNGDGYRGSSIWSENSVLEGPALAVSNVTSTGFSVTAQTRSSEGEGYHFSLTGDRPPGVTPWGERVSELEAGSPYTAEFTGLIPGKTYKISVTSRYGANYDMSAWSTTTVTLPLVSVRSQIKARR